MQARPLSHTLLKFTALCAAALPLLASAQVTQKPDGQWRSLITAGASVASGNTDAKSASLGADVINLTADDKTEFTAAGQYGRNDGATTAEKLAGSGLYSRNITSTVFGFGQADLLRDTLSDISLRATLGAGLGYHAWKAPDQTLDLSVGLAYTHDKYSHPLVIDNTTRSSYGHADLLLAEESSNKLSDTTTFKQKLTIYPNLRNSNDLRAVFDSGISVAMTKTLSLTATLSDRYTKEPGLGLKKNDLLFVTGVSVRFD